MRTCMVLILLVFTATGLGAEVITDYDRSANISQFQTFGWLEQEKLPVVRGAISEDNKKISDEDLDKMIRSYVEIELAKKGFVKAVDGAPDFLVSYYAVSKIQIEVQEFDAGTSANPNLPYGHWRPFYQSSSDTLLTSKGTLTLDIVDPSTNNLVWRGSATDIFEERDSAQRVQKKLRKIVQKILKKFPPK